MKTAKILFAAVLFSTLTIAQQLPEPILELSALPMYPPVAREARISGTVRIAFSLNVSGEVKEAKVMSGHPMLTPFALETVKAWRFKMPRDLYRTEWSYETEFVYRLSGHEVGSYQRPKQTISLSDFHRIEITSDTVTGVSSP